MSYELGALKWMIGMLLTPVGFVSLYIFGDGIWNTVTHFQALLHLFQFVDQPGVLVIGLAKIYVPTPKSILQSFFVYPVVGGSVGGLLWYIGVKG
jgi:hypothetical protein